MNITCFYKHTVIELLVNSWIIITTVGERTMFKLNGDVTIIR